MTQLDPSRYKRLTMSSPTYGQSDGLYWDGTDNQLCLVMDDAILTRIDSTGIEADLQFSGESRGDIIRRNATAWGRYSAKTSGQILVGDGTDVVSVAVSGDATITSGGVVSLAETMVRYASVNISSDEIVGNSAGDIGHASGVEIVASPGPGKCLELISAVVIYDYATAAYTDGGDVGVIYPSFGACSGVVSAANSIGAAGDKVALLLPAAPTNNQTPVNTGLALTAAAAFSQPGTAAGVVRVRVSYRIHTTGL